MSHGVAAVCLAAACGCIAATQDSGPAERVEIRLERTVCFGTCPDYSVTMRDDGTVTYQGRQFVRVSGSHTWRIDPAAVRALAREMEQAGFFEMKDEYSAMVTDLPTTYTTLTIGARTKKIKDYFGAPAKLKEIESRIDSVSGAKGYVSISGPAIREMQQKGWRATGGDAARWMNSARHEGDADVVRALLAAGADARATDEDGTTALMKAASSGDAETVRVLIADGSGHRPSPRIRTDPQTPDRRVTWKSGNLGIWEFGNLRRC